MLYLLISMALAALFAIFTNQYYDQQSLLPPAWVENGFWAIVGAGVVLSLLDWARCDMCERLKFCVTGICRHCPCHGKG